MFCRNCKSTKLKKVLIGNQPISSKFNNIKKNEKKYSLDLYQCNDCNLIQLGQNGASKSNVWI